MLLALLDQGDDLILLRTTALRIMEHMDALHLNEDHPLVQRAIVVLITLQDTARVTNPFRLYGTLQELWQKETPQVDLPRAELHGFNLQFNPTAMQVRARQTISVEAVLMLSQGKQYVDTTLFKLTAALKTRLDQLDEAQRKKIYTHTEAITGFSLTDLIANLEDNYFVTLLRMPYEKELSLYKAFLCAILTSIFDQPNSIEGDALLSPQEESLLMISASIRHCSTGKKEGIVLTYNTLDTKYQYSSSIKAQTDSQQKMLNFLSTLVEQQISRLLTTVNPLIEELAGPNQSSQLVHISLYLKNLLARHIGLAHNLQFDMHSDLLSQTLVAHPLEAVLTAFYQHLKISDSLAHLKAAFDTLAPQEKALLYNSCNELLNNKDLDDVWDLDDEGGYSLSDTGAVRLFLASGYIKEV